MNEQQLGRDLEEMTKAARHWRAEWEKCHAERGGLQVKVAELEQREREYLSSLSIAYAAEEWAAGRIDDDDLRAVVRDSQAE